MTNVIVRVACASALAVCASVVTVAAAESPPQPDAAPVVIDSCRSFVVTAGKARPTTGLHIRFRVRGDVAASAVEFAVSAPSRGTETLLDVGRFAPGVTISHTLAMPMRGATRTSYREPEPRCEVQGVRFVDGSRWEEPRT